jgi:antibiotic biosynthesis monooxygenase (ABM) superfamily enzyme
VVPPGLKLLNLLILKLLTHLMQQPKKWKMMLITWLFVYPTINILFLTVFPLVKDAHQLIKTLVLTLILVPLLGFFVPKLHKKFDAWIRK